MNAQIVMLMKETLLVVFAGTVFGLLYYALFTNFCQWYDMVSDNRQCYCPL